MMKAPMMTAVDPDAGMPSARRWTKAPQLSALTAASGPATPSIAPFPNFSGVFERCFSVTYDSMAEIVPPRPGAAPQKKPIPHPRRIAGNASFQSWRVNQILPFTRTLCIVPSRVPSAIRATSASAKMPTTTTRKLTPCCRSTIPMVKRDRPLCRSRPTQEIARPSEVDSRPFASESPVRALTVLNAKIISAKYSVGPKRRASWATGAAMKVNAVTPSVPAMKELIAAIDSAAPARPCRASG